MSSGVLSKTKQKKTFQICGFPRACFLLSHSSRIFMLCVNIAYFSSADSSLGKVDKNSLSQETLMELFMSTFHKTVEIRGEPDDVHELRDWKGLRFNDIGDVQSIFWSSIYLGGSVSFEWLPPTVEVLQINSGGLHRSIDLAALPDKIGKLALDNNRLDGSVTLDSLPEAMKFIKLSANKLNGSLNLENLPAKLETAHFDMNLFSGSIFLTSLPKSIQWLSVSQN
mmetsp:Transcript_4508/g.6797  ORF Transcript_4508/g.6797 Transcript_4508/m.6797 type:complete len:225 (-) Transcript_4508:279-953(-)